MDAYLTPVDDQYGTCERTCAVLRIYSGDMRPAEVSTLLGIVPAFTVGVGEQKPSNSIGRSRVGKVNGWFLSSQSAVESKDIRHHLDWLLGILRQSSEELRELQEHPGVRMSVDCIWWSKQGGGGPTLWPEQMRGLSDLNLECSFDFAYYGDEDGESAPSVRDSK
jgi:hypothetical protein